MLAEEAAKAVQLPEQQCNLVAWLDAMSAQVRGRIAETMLDAAAIDKREKMPSKEKKRASAGHGEEKVGVGAGETLEPKAHTIAAAVKASEHQIKDEGAIFSCKVCCQNVSKSAPPKLLRAWLGAHCQPAETLG